MSHWPYANLNQFPSAASTSDGTGLLNGSDYSLSDYPSEALTAQLETWSNLTFDFDNNESAPFEEKLSGAYDDQGRLGGGRHGAEDRGGVFSFDQANQFQHLLLESTLLHSQSTLDPSLSLSSALPSTSTATFDHFSLPTLASLPPLAPIASTSTSPVSSSSTTGASKNKKVKLSKETVESGNATREGSVVTPTELDEDASIEDKRKRNTAASGSFVLTFPAPEPEFTVVRHQIYLC